MKINYTPQNMPKKPVFYGKLERDIEKETFLSSFLERELRKGEYISKLKAKAVPQSSKLKVKNHRKIAYESSNIKVAMVTKNGKIKAVKKGTCYIYAYAQNGVYARIKVKVK